MTEKIFRSLHKLIFLLLLGMGMGPLQAQVEDSLASPSLPLWARSADSTAEAPKLRLRLRSPLIREGDSLRVDLRLPGRRPIQFGVPKVLFAPPPPPYDPKVAWQRAILLPGWGQYYNRQAWKMPFVYAGYGVAGFFIFTAQQNYKDYQRAYRIRIQRDQQGLSISEGDSLFMIANPLFERSNPNGLKGQRDLFRRNRDYYIILAIGYHLLQTLEAYITAHLRDLDVSDNLSLRIEPARLPSPGGPPGIGLGVSLKF
jgi:hypothetical protein